MSARSVIRAGGLMAAALLVSGFRQSGEPAPQILSVPSVVPQPVEEPFATPPPQDEPVPELTPQQGVLPVLQQIFRKAGVPPGLVWIAEVESSWNARAVSPAGAKGLFQFMPKTAERFGLKGAHKDDRTHPYKSARAAARYLRILHDRFGSWNLALAAYHAGEGRVSRAMSRHRADSYNDVRAYLPASTRRYVGRVLTTVTRRQAEQDGAAGS